ncbi:MAG TPA: prephenate dehydratase domain-containing protein [Gemmatimonadaceae bacterium]|nr:prephenate dehydratase domain-containing protein [Gemmatimonadaceae bacterium]
MRAGTAPSAVRRAVIVAIQGAAGSFSEGAAQRLAGRDARVLSCGSFDELFAAVARRCADRGVVPVHNTIAGPVFDNAQRVRAPAFVEMARLRYPVAQCLIARRRVPLGTLRRVASHPVALRQCARFFAAFPACARVEVADTGSGVRDLMAGALDVDAVIGSAAAARLFGGVTLLDRVDDAADNATEFVLFARAGSRAAWR